MNSRDASRCVSTSGIFNICNNPACKVLQQEHRYTRPDQVLRHQAQHRFWRDEVVQLSHQDVLAECKLYSHIFQDDSRVQFVQESDCK